IGQVISDQVVGPLQFALSPINDAIDRLEDIPKDFIVDQVTERFGINPDILDFLTDLGSKMDLRSITIDGKVVPVFQPDAHELLDSFMGIQGESQSEPLDEFTQNIPGVEFYREDDPSNPPRGSLNNNVEFDKTKFAAYANSVTLGKMLLLQETPTDPGFAGGQLSQLFTDLLGRPYDFKKLNLNGAHGGNVMTATLPKPGVQVEVGEPGRPTTPAASDQRPWLVLIDGDHQWRQDSQTVTTEQYRTTAPGTGANKVTWTFTGLPDGDYNLQASWLANVTF